MVVLLHSGSYAGGQHVTIHGSGLSGSATVRLCQSVWAQVVEGSAQHITFITPPMEGR